MPTKQETINFPIRKTRTASMKAGKTEEILPVRRSSRARTTKENFYDSPRRSTRATKDACDSPCRSSRRTETPTRVSRVAAKDADAGTPSKRKASISEVEQQDLMCSPSKQLVIELARLPKSISSPVKLPLKVCRQLLSEDSYHENSENTHKALPDKPIEDLPLSPVKFYPTANSPAKIQNVGSKSPLKSSNIINIASPRKNICCLISSLQSPSKSPSKPLRMSSPVKSPLKCLVMERSAKSPLKGRNSPVKSPLKRLVMDGPVKSPLKNLDFGSPRRSPRKLDQENAQSPRRTPRKLAMSPLKFSSPSSMISKLSLASPSNSKKNAAMGICKPNVTAYRAVRQSLNTGTPTTLVCREKQVADMESFLKEHLQNVKPGSLYVSGAPGTGKTASLNSILDSMKLPNIKKVFLNCMTLRTAGAIYSKIVSELGLQQKGTERENIKAIEKALTSGKNPVLIMLDEIDQLDSRNQEVLYSIFEWPALAGSKLVLVGIANALDLTDRILPRLQARPTFKPKLLHFPPYSKAEIIKIINQRIQEAGLGDIQVIKPAAVMFLAGKVASVAGDVRKALDVCRRAVELCEIQARRQSVIKPTNGSPSKSPTKRPSPPPMKMVEVPQVLAIFNEVYGSRVISAVTDAPESFPLQQKVLICSLLLIMKHAKSKDLNLGKFHDVYTKICKKRNLPGIDQSEFLSLCTLLESRGMLQVKKAKEIRSSKVILRLNVDEAEQTLGDRNLLAAILEDKESLGKLCKQ
ncbi:cell division control protein 6 homolog [Penaeus vannamei]|uniref:cell division control protein 6 homolog n=1 Tax=Penaeus vannamei TaxID=6689 RepID=UPI000F670842|nr:cell division control protein 6 homolog [Penaeus vannamei]